MEALRCPPGDAECLNSQAVKPAGCASANCCCASLTCLLLDEPTNHLDAETIAGWSSTCASIAGHPDASPTTGTFSTMSPAGFWSSTAVAASRTRATTPPIWSRRPSAIAQEAERTAPAEGAGAEQEWIALSQRPARPSQRPVSAPMTSWSRPVRPPASRPRRSSFPGRAVAASGDRRGRPQEGIWRPPRR